MELGAAVFLGKDLQVNTLPAEGAKGYPTILMGDTGVGWANLHLRDAPAARRVRDAITAAVDPGAVMLDPANLDDCNALAEAVPELDTDSAAAALRAIAAARTARSAP